MKQNAVILDSDELFGISQIARLENRHRTDSNEAARVLAKVGEVGPDTASRLLSKAAAGGEDPVGPSSRILSKAGGEDPGPFAPVSRLLSKTGEDPGGAAARLLSKAGEEPDQ